MLRLINLCGLGNVDSDQMIGRLLDSKAIAEANPGKVEEWTKAGKAFRLEKNPKDRPGLFSAVLLDVAPDDETLVHEVTALGFRHNDGFEGYDGKIDVAAALDALRGTEVTLRVKVGRPKKGQGRYIVALDKGKEVEGARAILFGDDGVEDKPATEAASNEAAGKSSGAPVRFGLTRIAKTETETGSHSSGEADKAE